MTAIVVGLVLVWAAVGLLCWVGYQLVVQSGRLLLRLEALEAQPGAVPATDAESAADLPVGSVLHDLVRKQEDSTRYVVSIRPAGLGDRLICLGAAWLFARHTDRTLVADWRHGAYATRDGTNLFVLCFEPLPEVAGVAFVGDDRVAGLSLPRPRHPAHWNDDSWLASLPPRTSSALLEERDEAVAMIRAGGDVPAPTVIFDACVNDGLVSVADSRTFLSGLRPVSSVARQVAAFRDEQLRGNPFIGLHIRHGNGTPVGNHARYWHSFWASINRCGRAVQAARRRLGEDLPVLLCTDSVDVQRAICATIPGVITRPKAFRPPGAGELHVGRDSYQGLDDALVEMLLLAEANALIRYPPGSFFSFYAAVMRHWQSPLPPTLYDLQRPYDSEDPLSPALLV
ncbi:MAG TPA: nodulation protein NodZ [Chloroflexota bacterium]|nr:nodulation protein NodZ [Chloroflexota bacterium]